MGLDTTHDAWHGAYSAFNRWRVEIAKVAGLPPLHFMEGFFVPQRKPGEGVPAGIPTIFVDHNATDLAKGSLAAIEAQLPIKWECLKPSPLHELLYHSDCDGEIKPKLCAKIADELEKLIPLLPDGDAGGHIGHWRIKTQQFIDGLRAAATEGVPLEFH